MDNLNKIVYDAKKCFNGITNNNKGQKVINSFLDNNIRYIVHESINDINDFDYVTIKSEMGLLKFKFNNTVLEINAERKNGLLVSIEGIVTSDCKGYQNGSKVFEITIGEQLVINEVDSIGIDLQTVSSVDLDKNEFKYEEMSNGQTIFSGYLSPFNVKHRNNEIFEYTGIIPEVIKPDTLIAKFISGLKGKNFVGVRVSSTDIIDYMDFTDELFKELKNKAYLHHKHTKKLEKTIN